MLGEQGSLFGIWDEPSQERSEFRALRVGVLDHLLFWFQKYFMLLTHIPWLVTMETMDLTSPWLPWCWVLEDPSWLYTARDKQGLQPKLLPLPSCHHLLTVMCSGWGRGDGDRTAGERLRAESYPRQLHRCPTEEGRVSCQSW